MRSDYIFITRDDVWRIVSEDSPIYIGVFPADCPHRQKIVTEIFIPVFLHTRGFQQIVKFYNYNGYLIVTADIDEGLNPLAGMQ